MFKHRVEEAVRGAKAGQSPHLKEHRHIQFSNSNDTVEPEATGLDPRKAGVSATATFPPEKQVVYLTSVIQRDNLKH